MLLSIPIGATSKIIQIPIFDSSSTTGALLTGLVFNTASLTAYYNREGAVGAAVAITLATATKGTWATGGFVAVDGTNTPGWYELHIPDAALASGAKSVVIHLKGATNMVPAPILIELTATSNQDAVRGGMTALPSSGTLAVNPILNATQTGVTIPTVTTLTGHTAQTGDNFARLGAPAGASVSADVAAVKVDTAAVKVKTDFLPSAAAGAAGGVAIAGSNAATTFASLTVTAATTLTGNVLLSDGLTVAAPSTLNRAGVTVTGNGTGDGIITTGGAGAGGDGMTVVAGGGVSLNATLSTLTTYTGNTLQTADAATRMATYTQPAGFLAATFPAGTVANQTNITAAAGVVLSGVTHTGAVIPTVTAVTNGVTVATGGIGGGATTAAELNNIADGMLNRVLSAGTDSGADNTTARTVRQALRGVRNRVAVAGGVATVYKEDDVTASHTAAVTTTAGNPVSEVNPT